MYKKIILALTIFIMTFSCFASDAYHRYDVQKGDTLGKILFDLNYSPLWGPHGFVKKTIDLNEGKFPDGGDFIVIGASIKLPIKEEVFVTKKSIASVEEEIQPEFDLKSFVSLSLSGLMYEVQSKDISTNALARVETKFNHSYAINISTQWSERVWSHIGFGQTSVSFKEPEQRTIGDAKSTYSSMHVGGSYTLSSSTAVGLLYHVSQRPYLMASSTGDLKMESPWLHSFVLSIDQKLISRKNGSLSIGVKPYLVMKKTLDDIKLKNGKGAVVEIKMAQKVMGLNFEALMFYEFLKQDSDVVKQTTKSNGVKFSLIIPFGE